MNRKHLLFIAILLLIFPIIFWRDFISVGGDDSKLYYLFPLEYFKNFTLQLISGNSLGTLGFYFSQAYISGFSLAVYLIYILFPFLSTELLLLGTNLSLGFVFLYLFLGLWIKNDSSSAIRTIASLFYVFSTFSMYTLWQSQLFSVYLICLFPLLAYLLCKGVADNKPTFIIWAAVMLSVFSMTLFSVPWISALFISLLPLSVLLYTHYAKRTVFFSVVFFILLCLLNFYWVFHFAYSPYSSDNYTHSDLSSSVNAEDFRSIGDNVVRSVSENNEIIYPLLGLFHKNIQKDFGWQTYTIFSQWHLKFMYLDYIFLIPILLALLYLRKADIEDRRIYLASLVSWLMTLFLFTVKIGDWGVNVFVWLNNNVPGFVMFKNMYDKFGIAMAFSYAFLFAISLKIVFETISSDRIKKYALILIFGVILLNAKPFIFGDFYKASIWTTKETYNTISDFNADFYDLLAYLKPMNEASRFLWLPLNNANYIQISDKNLPNHYYSGVSPLQFLANKSDFNGKLSFPAKEGDAMFQAINNGNYEVVGRYLQQFNVKYIIINHDISPDLQQSYLFGHKLFDAQNDDFYRALLGDKVKDFGKRYSLYEISKDFSNEKIYLTDNEDIVPTDFQRVKYEKLASYEYKVSINGLKGKKHLVFLDPYHKQWEWRFQKDGSDFIKGSHAVVLDYANGWNIDADFIKKNFAKQDYVENPDGSIDLDLTLYFKPQDYFYRGLVVSGVALVGCFLYLSYTWRGYCKKSETIQ